MSTKKCAKCDKTVYPTEELRCLDKTWHKSCFRCETCAMALSMKNYKGFDKLPYCGAHIPKAKATVIADTPENRRLAENSKIQSNVIYHADFEATKGKFTQIADDPEVQRIKANTQTISNVAYHGTVENKLDQDKRRILVDDPNYPSSLPIQEGHDHHPVTLPEMEDGRDVEDELLQSVQHVGAMSKGQNSANNHLQSQQSGVKVVDPSSSSLSRHPGGMQRQQDVHVIQSRSQPIPPPSSNQPGGRGSQHAGVMQHANGQQHVQGGNERMLQQATNANSAATAIRQQQQHQDNVNTRRGQVSGGPPQYNQQHARQYQQQQHLQQHMINPGPGGKNSGGLQNIQMSSSTNRSRNGMSSSGHPSSSSPQHQTPNNTRLLNQNQQQRQIPPVYHQNVHPPPSPSSQGGGGQYPGSYNTTHHSGGGGGGGGLRMNGGMSGGMSVGGSLSKMGGQQQQQRSGGEQMRSHGNNRQQPPQSANYNNTHQQQHHQQYLQHNNQNHHSLSSNQQLQSNHRYHQGGVQPQHVSGDEVIGKAFEAMYDYEAQDTDEVSFKDGDLIINCQSIDQGWMTGTVQRTGKFGMLPANYVQRVEFK